MLNPYSKLSSRSRLFYQTVAETFNEHELTDSLLDVAERIKQTEDFLIYLAKQQDLIVKIINSKKPDKKLVSHLNKNFWVHLKTIINLPKHQIRFSEYIEILLSWYVKNVMEIEEIFSADNPMDDKTFLISNLITDLNRELNTVANKKNITNRQSGIQKNVEKITNYIYELNRTYSKYTVIRIDLGYEADNFWDIEISEHMAHLHSARRHKPALFKNVFGYITKLEYSNYKGYYWRTLFFFNGLNSVDAHTHSEKIGEYWKEVIVKSEGHYQIIKLSEGTVEDTLRSAFFNQNVLDAARYLCEKDAIIRPHVDVVKLLRTGQISNVKKPKVVPESVPRGRKRHIDPEQIALLKQQGLGATEIAKRLGISRSAVYKLTPKSAS